jgi:hypothetical protein
MRRPDVFDATMVSPETIESRRPKMSCLSESFSGAASMMRSQSLALPRSSSRLPTETSAARDEWKNSAGRFLSAASRPPCEKRLRADGSDFSAPHDAGSEHGHAADGLLQHQRSPSVRTERWGDAVAKRTSLRGPLRSSLARRRRRREARGMMRHSVRETSPHCAPQKNCGPSYRNGTHDDARARIHEALCAGAERLRYAADSSATGSATAVAARFDAKRVAREMREAMARETEAGWSL